MKKLILITALFAAHVFADDTKTFTTDVAQVESISSKKEIGHILVVDEQCTLECEIEVAYAEMLRNIEVDMMKNMESNIASLSLEFKD